MSESIVDVLVVGAGPAGLAAACGLKKSGIDVMVVDAGAAGTNTSRAAVVHAKTLEVLEQIDVSHTVVDEGVVVPEFTIRDGARELARFDFSTLPTRYPFTVMIPQSQTERILEDRLEALGGHVRRSTAVESMLVRSGRPHVVLRREDGAAEEITARFVIGADGARSVVRSEVGIAFEGSDYEQAFVLADVTMRWPLPQNEVQLFFAADGLVVVAPLPAGRHRVVATVDTAPQHPSIDDVQRILDGRGPGATTVESMAWSSRFRVAHRLASRYREGHVFLAGDAAHVHSPAGGQGMNTGIQDALDLAQTLAPVVNGEARESTLDGYEQRRRPVAARVVKLTDRMTRMATVEGRVARQLRNVVVSSALRSGRLRTAAAMRIAELR